MCQKQQHRDLFSLLAYFSCEGCHQKIIDEEIWIGVHSIRLYHINTECFVEPSDQCFYFNKRLQQLLYETIRLKPPLILWVDYFETLQQKEDLFELLFTLSSQIYIIVF